MHTHPALVLYFKILFSIILKTGHVPDKLGKGIVILIINDKFGNPSSNDNSHVIHTS